MKYKQIYTVFILILLTISSNIYGQLSNINSVQEKILQKLNLTIEEKDILKEISETNFYINEWEKQVVSIDTEILELDKIIDASKNFHDINCKAIKEKKDKLINKDNIQYDIEEYKEIANNLLNNIYLNHNKQITNTTSKYKYRFTDAKKMRDNAYKNPNIKISLDLLSKADCIEKEALKNQEKIFAKSYNIETNCKYFETDLVAEYDNKTNVKQSPNNTEIAMDNTVDMDQSNIEKKYTNSIPIDSSVVFNSNENIIFKIQVGAFCNTIDQSVFKGLPLSSIDKSDVRYDKYMIGEYISYELANKSLKKLVSSTEFKDAFIVAYKNGKRLPAESLIAYHILDIE